jgi:L-amino acid N-acyltransferase YncA
MRLPERAAKLVQVTVQGSERGRGIGSELIARSTELVLQQDFDRLYARIWHSNKGSIRAFEKAGWRSVALALGVGLGDSTWRISLPVPGRVAFVR